MSAAFVGGIGVPELLIVLAIVLVIFGGRRLPQLGRDLGSGMRGFKDTITSKSGDDDESDPPRAPGDDDDDVPGEAPVVEGEVVPERR